MKRYSIKAPAVGQFELEPDDKHGSVGKWEDVKALILERDQLMQDREKAHDKLRHLNNVILANQDELADAYRMLAKVTQRLSDTLDGKK
jgi:hypothetical protein